MSRGHLTLAELPHFTACTVQRVGSAVREAGYHLVAGLTAGASVRVLAAYPESDPRFLEVEVAGHTVITLPLPLARHVALASACC